MMYLLQCMNITVSEHVFATSMNVLWVLLRNNLWGYQRSQRWKHGVWEKLFIGRALLTYGKCNYWNWKWLLAGSTVSINTKHTNYSELSSIVDMCHQMLGTNNNRKVRYVRRQTNQVAHEIAQATRFIASFQSYNYFLPCIEFIVWNEMN
jgi:hypothetical protein